MSLYSHPDNLNYWNGVVTCFFIDTAPVVLEYIEVIYNMLVDDGIWINLGPLLYHWVSDDDNNNDDRYNQSIELSWEELRHVIVSYGFEIIKEERIETGYCSCDDLMLVSTYK